MTEPGQSVSFVRRVQVLRLHGVSIVWVTKTISGDVPRVEKSFFFACCAAVGEWAVWEGSTVA